MFELFINREIQDSVVSLSWCISQDTLAALGRDYGLTNPQLLIAVIPEEGGKGSRQVVPLTDLMAPRVELVAPGRNRIYAFVLGKYWQRVAKKSGPWGKYPEKIEFRDAWDDERPFTGDTGGEGEYNSLLSAKLGFAPDHLFSLRRRKRAEQEELAAAAEAGDQEEPEAIDEAPEETEMVEEDEQILFIRSFLVENCREGADIDAVVQELQAKRPQQFDETDDSESGSVEAPAAQTKRPPTYDEQMEEVVQEWGKPVLELSDIGTHLDVEVPDGVFAPEPSDWEKAWCNWMIDSEADNQCNFRRRRLWAYTGQLFLVFPLLYIVRMVAALWLLLSLYPGVNIQPLLHPLTNGSSAVWDNVGRPFWGNSKGSVPLFPFAVLTPLGVLFLGGLGLLIGFAGAAGGSWFWLALLFFIPIAAALLLLWGLVGALAAAAAMLNGWPDIKDRISGWLNPNDADWWADEDVVSDLSCAREQQLLTFADLPRHKRTIRLRYMNLKAQVCKPFAKR